MKMTRIASTLMIAAAAVLLVSSEASAQWTCTAHSVYGSNHGWGSNYDRASAARRALAECNIRGGGCRLTGCNYEGPRRSRRGYPCPSGWCE